MHRRTFLSFAAATLVAAPRISFGQEMRRIAIAAVNIPVTDMKTGIGESYGLLLEELEGLGWVEGQNIIIARFSAEGDVSRYPGLAESIISGKPEVIYGPSNLLASLTALTDTIPIVSVLTNSSITAYVESLARPGGNVTGPANSTGVGIQAKRLQILLDSFPQITRVAVLGRTTSWPNEGMEAVRDAANQFGITLIPMLHEPSVDEQQFRRLFQSAKEQSVEGFLIITTNQIQQYKELIIQLANETGLPAMYSQANFVDDGGLMSYGDKRISERYRRAAWYVDRILKGANPAELPVEQPTGYNFIINLRTAREIGITFSTRTLLTATDVVE